MNARAKDAVSRTVTAVHAAVYRVSGGRVGARIGNVRILLLTHTGRVSGTPHTIPLSFLADGDVRVLVASYGGDDRHPQWYQNLVARPDATVQVGDRTERVRARTASPDEKAAYWPRVVAMYRGYDAYQRRTQRDIPLVILTPV